MRKSGRFWACRRWPGRDPMEGSRFVKDSFGWHDQRFEAQERIMALQFGTMEKRLERIEALIEGLERRLWMCPRGAW